MLVSLGQGDAPLTTYLKEEVVALEDGVNVLPLKLPLDPDILVQVPPEASPAIKSNKLMGVTEELQMEVEPSSPAAAGPVILTVAILVSLGQGDDPVNMYLNTEVVALSAGVKVLPLNVPPDPDILDQVPPPSSPEIRLNKFIGEVEVLQIAVDPSVPALTPVVTETEAKLVSFGQGDEPMRIYLNIELVAPVGTKVPVEAVKLPPLPEVLDQVPPLCSPVIKLKRLMLKALLEQTVVIPSVPAETGGVITTVAILVSPGQGGAPATMYLKVEVVALAAGVKEFPLKVPPVPVSLDHTPPTFSPVIKLNKLMAVVEVLQIEVVPSAPALTVGQLPVKVRQARSTLI